MKLRSRRRASAVSPVLVALALRLCAAAAPAAAIELEEAKAACRSGELPCPEGSEPGGGKAHRSDTLQCRRDADKHGPSVACGEDGKVRSFGEWKDGKREGRFVTYHQDGSWFESEFHEGKLHGREVRYFASGKIALETEYRDGRKHGKSRGYRLDGTPMFEDDWVDGKKVASTFTFRDGRRKHR